MKLPPVAARQLRDEARVAAIEQLSARRSEAEHMTIKMAVDIYDEQEANGPDTHRSCGSHANGVIDVAAVRESKLGLGFISPEYAEDFESGHNDAVTQHVNAFMGTNSEVGDGLPDVDNAAAETDQHSTYPDVSTYKLFKMRCFLSIFRGKTLFVLKKILFENCMTKCSCVSCHMKLQKHRRTSQFTKRKMH